MKSDVIAVRSNGEGMPEALEQTEAVAEYKRLPKKNALRLRLLCEETMGMMRSLTGEREAFFWIEDKDGSFELHLKTETPMDMEKRRGLLNVATSGKNASAKGVMGKIRDIFDMLTLPADASAYQYGAEGLRAGYALPSYVTGGLMYDMETDALSLSMLANMSSWSLRQYKESVAASEDSPTKAEEWDELEKSVVAKLADEVKIFIDGDAVEMVIYKKF